MHTLTISYDLFNSWEELPPLDRELIEQAYQIAHKAYAPYSQFFVGAALRLEDQTIVCGSNQENIAYPSGLCAERTALFFAGANYPDTKIQKMAVVGWGELTDPTSLLSPCRQVMIESEKRQKTAIEVILVSQNKKTICLKTMRDLLPFAFIE